MRYKSKFLKFAQLILHELFIFILVLVPILYASQFLIYAWENQEKLFSTQGAMGDFQINLLFISISITFLVISLFPLLRKKAIYKGFGVLTSISGITAIGLAHQPALTNFNDKHENFMIVSIALSFILFIYLLYKMRNKKNTISKFDILGIGLGSFLLFEISLQIMPIIFSNSLQNEGVEIDMNLFPLSIYVLIIISSIYAKKYFVFFI